MRTLLSLALCVGLALPSRAYALRPAGLEEASPSLKEDLTRALGVPAAGLEELHVAEPAAWRAVPGGAVLGQVQHVTQAGHVVGRIVTPDVSRVQLVSVWNPAIESADFPRWQDPPGPIDDTKARQVVATGQPLDAWWQQLSAAAEAPGRLVWLANEQQNNFRHPFGPLVSDGRVVRQAYARRTHPINAETLRGKEGYDDAFWTLILEADTGMVPRVSALRFRVADGLEVVDQELTDVEIDHGQPVAALTRTQPKIRHAIPGVPLLLRGRDVSDQIRSNWLPDGSRRELRPNEVTWQPQTTRAAFSAEGIAHGRLTRAALTVPLTVAEFTHWLQQQGFTDAILLGGSADVHERLFGVAEPSTLMAEAREGSTAPGADRPLNVVRAGFERPAAGLEELDRTPVTETFVVLGPTAVERLTGLEEVLAALRQTALRERVIVVESGMPPEALAAALTPIVSARAPVVFTVGLKEDTALRAARAMLTRMPSIPVRPLPPEALNPLLVSLGRTLGPLTAAGLEEAVRTFLSTLELAQAA